MRLVLYSGGYKEENHSLDKELLRIVGNANPRVCFIPSSHNDSDEYFNDFVEQFSAYGWNRFELFHVDRPFSEYDADYALTSDMVYLSGGNTFYFLHHLKKTRMLKKLHRYAYSEGTLAGLSAGAIMMTPNIRTAGIPHFDRDENEVGITDLSALNLLNFEFFPHYENHKSYDRCFLPYSQTLNYPLYTAVDGAGIVIANDKITFVGEIWAFVKGCKFLIA